MACTRKKQCLYGDMCPTARSDEYNLIDASCYKPLEQTNEEWFCELSTEEKAKWLENKMTWAAQEQGTFTAKGWEMWLKQPHRRE